MKKLISPVFLKIETEEQLNNLADAIQMQHDMIDDIVLDETVNTVREVRELASLSDEDITTALRERIKSSNENIDRLLSIVELQNNLQKVINTPFE